MSTPHLIIRRAQLRRQQGLRDIAIYDGRIAAITEHIDGTAAATSVAYEIDANGGLVTESFVDPHLHLCKVYTLMRMDTGAVGDYHGEGMGKAMSAIEAAARVKADYHESWIYDNVKRNLDLALKYGNTHKRALVDVDSKAKLEGIKAVIRAREAFKGRVDLQVVAFAQDGIVREAGAAELMRQAMEMGADVVGGIPWLEYTAEDRAEHVKFCFDLAQEFNADVSFLVDDVGDAESRTIEEMAVAAIKRGWQGRVLAHHARAMALYSPPYMQKLIALLKKADLSVVTDPHTGPLHARVKELLAAGVNVCLGQDDVSDSYYPFGRNNMLEVAFLAAHLLWMTTLPEMETLYDMITHRAAKAMGLTGYGLKVGNAADLVVLDAPNVLEALREHAAPKWVIRNGVVIG